MPLLPRAAGGLLVENPVSSGCLAATAGPSADRRLEDEEYLSQYGPRRFTDEQLAGKMLEIGVPAWWVELQYG